MGQQISRSGYQGIRILIITLLHWSFVIGHWSFAAEPPRFRGAEVVVTAARLPQKLSDSPWNTTVIPEKELANYRTVGEALRTVLGIDSQSYGHYGSLNSLRLRGASASQLLIMVDGRRINSPTLGMVDAGDLPLANVEKIEVVRSPLSALYGSDAVSGAVNIITKGPRPEASLAVSGGPYNTRRYQLAYGGRDFLINASGLRSDGFRRNGDCQATDLAGKLIYPTWFGPVTLDLAVYDAVKGVPGVPTSEADPASSTTPNDRQKDQNVLASATWTTREHQLKVYHNAFDQQLDPYLFGASRNLTWQSGIEFQQKLGHFLYGVEAREDHGRTTMTGDHQVWNYAAYLQEELNLTGSFSLIAGLRGDKHSTAGKAITPRLGMVYRPVDEVTLRAAAGTAFRAPTLNELYWNDGWMFGDPALKPEQSVNYELGLERRFSDNLAARVNYYSTTTTDLILWDWQSSSIETRAKNVGEVYAEGVEFELERKFGAAGRAFANFTYQTAVDRKDFDPLAVGKTIRYTPRTKYNAGLILAGNTVLVRYVGERYADQYNTVVLPAYTVVDLRFTRQVGRAELELKVDNALDEQYSEAVGNDPFSFAVREYPLPGRTYSLGVKWMI